MEFVHKSVLFDEAIKALDLNKNKIIVDGTAGGGGHSGEIAKTAKRVISIDQDPDAIEVLNERLGNKENVLQCMKHAKEVLPLCFPHGEVRQAMIVY